MEGGEHTPRAYLIKGPGIGPATLKHLVDDAFGFLLGRAVGVRRDREDGATADARLVLLGEGPVAARKLAVELAVAAQGLGADLWAQQEGGQHEGMFLTEKGRGRTSVHA